MLYKDELLGGDSLLSWHAKLEEKDDRSEFEKSALKQMTQFVEWLKKKNEESEDDEEDDEDSDDNSSSASED